MVGKKESGTCAKTGVDASQPYCTSLFIDSKSITAGSIPWNYSSSGPRSRSRPIFRCFAPVSSHLLPEPYHPEYGPDRT